ncbi:MAG: UTP--glucose-1-phosphate uridylyltransferase [Bryobacterales bacterium]|nr:UTP--glucose-1-phosphate uridylyltransferase [Bryobacterales bacterium]
MSRLLPIVTSQDPAVRNRSLDAECGPLTVAELFAECEALDRFRRNHDNLYQRVRALFFLYGIHRFHLPARQANGGAQASARANGGAQAGAKIPFAGYNHLLKRRFSEAIDVFLDAQSAQGPGPGISSALASAYHSLAFQTLADQVRRSVRSVRGNQWMFRIGHPADYPLRIRRELLERRDGEPLFPILHEATPVRMDLSHSGWSDIFFLGMDYPEGARVLNISIDLSVRGTGAPKPPVEAYFRVIDQPVLRLVSVDLNASVEIRSIAEVFDFARDYLGLLKAAVIASGLIPPGIEGATQPLSEVLAQLVGLPGHGIEIVSKVNDIPKGSRLAVSTNLLASLIAVCMRATNQIHTLSGGLEEGDRRLVAARAILGEWLGGSGGGWQDSGGVWPGMKLIQGVPAMEGDPEFGISRGCLLPRHRILGEEEISEQTRQKLQESLVLVHGGMAQDVGPILEMVTEKYLLRSEREWEARGQAVALLQEMLGHLRAGDIQSIGAATQSNFDGPVQTIIPWAANFYTRLLIDGARKAMGEDFWGFWMLGGMAGGGMGFLFRPEAKAMAQDHMQELMSATKRRLQHAVAFAMEPVVYNFAINSRGTQAQLLEGHTAMMPAGYYTLSVPGWLRTEPRLLSPSRRAELDRFSAACRNVPEFRGMVERLFDHLLPQGRGGEHEQSQSLDRLLQQHGFDRVQHEQIQNALRNGHIGLAQNRMPVSTTISDVAGEDINHAAALKEHYRKTGMEVLAAGAVAVVSLAGGAGSRWTKGAGVVKALSPFCRAGGRHRTFLEVHLAKSRRMSKACGTPVPHIITTSYLSHDAIASYLEAEGNYGYSGPLVLSPGCSIGLRMIPMERDLRFAWEEMPQQLLDEQAQKVRESLHAALIGWARQMGEGSNYIDNLPLQCLHPVGHWYEIPNLLRNGVLRDLLAERPQLRYLMAHNIDTVGADLDPALLGLHVEQGAAMTMEVIPRHLEDRGGGLARVNGRLRLVEGLALPDDEIESRLSYYNSATAWIDVDRMLEVFGFERQDLGDERKVTEAVRRVAARMPTYITLKDVKKRWGKGQEDVYPVAQFEKLWGDMTALPELDCRFTVVARERGQQLKDPSQLDGWLRDGSADFVASLCDWGTRSETVRSAGG